MQERFRKYVGEPDANGCMVWTGTTNASGYGVIGVTSTKNVLAHRLSYEIANGEIPAGLHVLHKCDNPPCVNPDHLFVGTDADNILDMCSKGRAAVGEQRSPLTTAQVIDIRRRRSQGETQQALADKYGVSRESIRQIVNGQTWKHLLT